MAFDYATVSANILRQAGFAYAEASSDVQNRIYYWIDEAILEFQKYHRNYYYQDISFRRKADSAALAGSISQTSGSHTATITYTGSWQDLVGATIIQGTELNIVRVVTNTSTKACELLFPSRFTNAAISIKCRSCNVTTASRVSPKWRYCSNGHYLTDESGRQSYLYLLANDEFFSNSDLMEPVNVYPSSFTIVNDIPVLDVDWPLDSGWSVSFKVERAPVAYNTTADILDLPAGYQKAVEQYVVGRLLISQGDERNGLLELRRGERSLMTNFGVN